jgi:hypothetical protein
LENANQQIEIYLGKYVSYFLDHRAKWLLAAEFAKKHHASASTRFCPFLAAFSHSP